MKTTSALALCLLLSVYGCSESIEQTLEKTCSSKLETRSIEPRHFTFPPLQWENFKTHQEKLAACQIPDNILQEIPTDELIKICLEYPLLFDAFAFDTPIVGLKKVISRFNGFQELMKRKDNCLTLFNYLKKIDITPQRLNSLNLVEVGNQTLIFSLCEYLLSLEGMTVNATESLKQDIAVYSYQTLQRKEIDASHHALSGMTSSVYLCASMANSPLTKKTRPLCFG